LSGASIREPPTRLRASPIEVTVTSIASPGRANGASVAVTMTAATLRLCTSSAASVRSKRASMLAIDWRVALLRAESPVPARPVTRP
jgi:hypothetical protein